MRSLHLIFAVALMALSACVAACDDDSGEPASAVQGASEAKTARPASTASAATPAADDVTPADAADTFDDTPATAVAASPAAAATPTLESAPSSITITFVEFDCDGYRFAVESQPEALLRVHWTAIAPDDPAPGSSRSVSDNEVSQSPGEHTFEESKQDWAKPGSNRLTIRGENVAGGTHEESRAIDC
jgi:hypothetical protein